MTMYETLLPYSLLMLTLIIELISFLTSHMIDSRNLVGLHEGIFQRCLFASQTDRTSFNCRWWSADTYNADNSYLKATTILVFISLIFVGLTILYGICSYYYEELRAFRYKQIMASANVVNVILLLLIILLFSFGYATDTSVIPGRHSTLVFSWSYYLLFGAIGSSVLSAAFFLYNPFVNNSQQTK